MSTKLTKSPMLTINVNTPVSHLHNSSSTTSNFYHVKNKPYLPTVTSAINKSLNYRNYTTNNTIAKATPDKRLNRKIIDYLNTTPSMSMTKSVKANQSFNQLGTFDNKTGGNDSNVILSQELKSSNNILTSLQDIVNNLNVKLGQMAQDNMNLSNYYQKEINNLQAENDFMRNCNQKDKDGNAISAHMQLLNEEEEQLKKMLKEKKSEMKRIENKIEKVSNDIKIQQNENVPTVNSFYQSMIKRKEQEVNYLTEINKGNVILVDKRNHLLSKSIMQSLTYLLQLKISLLSEHINEDLFVQSLLECNKRKKRIDCCMITEKYRKLTHDTNEKDKEVIEIYFESLLAHDDDIYSDIDYLQKKLQWFINGIKDYSDNEHYEYTTDVISLLRPYYKKIHQAFLSRDIDKKGVITLDVFNNVFKKLNITLTDNQLPYVFYIMRKTIDQSNHILELSYNDLIMIIKPQKKIDNYIEKIRSHIQDRQISIGDFLRELMSTKIEKIQDLKYLENDHMNDFLREKGVLTDDEELDKDNTPELINVDFLMNLFEQENIESQREDWDIKAIDTISQCIGIQENYSNIAEQFIEDTIHNALDNYNPDQ